MCAPRRLTRYPQLSWGKTKKNVSKSTNLPGVERQKGQQHVGQAENGEKALKLLFGNTCVKL